MSVLAGSAASKGREREISVPVTLVITVPGAMRLAVGPRIIPAATPSVCPAAKVRVCGAAAGVPEVGRRVRATNGGCMVKVTEAGEPVSPLDRVTSLVVDPGVVRISAT